MRNLEIEAEMLTAIKSLTKQLVRVEGAVESLTVSVMCKGAARPAEGNKTASRKVLDEVIARCARFIGGTPADFKQLDSVDCNATDVLDTGCTFHLVTRNGVGERWRVCVEAQHTSPSAPEFVRRLRLDFPEIQSVVFPGGNICFPLLKNGEFNGRYVFYLMVPA